MIHVIKVIENLDFFEYTEVMNFLYILGSRYSFFKGTLFVRLKNKEEGDSIDEFIRSIKYDHNKP